MSLGRLMAHAERAGAERELLAQVVEELRAVTYVLVCAFSDAGADVPEPHPVPRLGDPPMSLVPVAAPARAMSPIGDLVAQVAADGVTATYTPAAG